MSNSYYCDHCGDYIEDEEENPSHSWENRYNVTLTVCQSCYNQLKGGER